MRDFLIGLVVVCAIVFTLAVYTGTQERARMADENLELIEGLQTYDEGTPLPPEPFTAEEL